MSLHDASGPSRAGLAALFLVPAAHPLFIPLVGVPSHLLWWAHVLPVALLTFHRGRTAAVEGIALSALLVALGELTFGAGYGRPADLETVLLLTGAVTATNLLVVWFALHARRVGARYRILLDNVRMGVLQLDPGGRIVSANAEARTLLGGDGASLEGRDLEEVVSVPGGVGVTERATRGGWTGSLEVRSPDGCRSLPVFLVAVPDAEGEGSQLLVLDRTLELAQEQELERQSRLAALGEALAGVAHELNNPLTTILAHAQLGGMGSEEGSDEGAEAFGIIEEEAGRMRDLIRELLGFSRRRSGEGSVRLGPLLERLVHVQRLALPRDVTLDVESGWDGAVRGSAAKVEQIVLNLVANAAYEVEGAGGGGVVVATRRRDGVAEVEVRDDGPGIPEELLPTVFEPFVTTKPEGEGTGLGLAISRRLARSWGGELTARNGDGGGAVFTLTLPVDPEAGTEAAEAPDPIDVAPGEGEVGHPSGGGGGLVSPAVFKTVQPG